MKTQLRIILFALLLLVVVASLLVLNGCERAAAQGKLQIMFSGNIKGNVKPCGCHVSKGGVSRLATFINRNHLPNANWLTVDAGNYVDRAGEKGGCSNKCAFMINSYQDLSYDAMNLGKAEVWMGLETIRSLQDSAKHGTQFVSANLVEKKNGKPVVKPYITKDYGNMKVAILGLLNESDFTSPATIDTNALRVLPYISTARKYVSDLHKSCSAVVVLADLSTPAIDSLVKAVPGIDLVISSGSLSSGETGTKIGKTRVIGTGSSGYNGHSTVLEFNPSWKDSIAFSDLCVALDSTYQEPGKWTDRLVAFDPSYNPTPAVPATTTAPTSPTSSSQPGRVISPSATAVHG
jgi:2',3'-cyclic-nucleotide 2'-phosphodiesterase (5'-nucleotidase family)